MQTKLFVFFSILAFCHIIEGEPDVTETTASPRISEEVLKGARQLEQALEKMVNASRGNFELVLSQIFNPDTVNKIMSSFTGNSFENLSQIEDVLKNATKVLQDTLESVMTKIIPPDAKKLIENFSELGKTVADKIPQTLMTAVEGASKAQENIAHTLLNIPIISGNLSTSN